MIEGAAVATQQVLQGVDPADVTAGGIGFVVIASLAVGTAILLRSMNKQLKKVDFDEEPDTDQPGTDRADTDRPDTDHPETDRAETDRARADAADADRAERHRAETDGAGDKTLGNGSLGDRPEEGPRSSAP